MQDLNVILDALKDFEIPSEIKGTMYVYAIREVNSGNIKLGISRNPKARLKDLQTGKLFVKRKIGTKMSGQCKTIIMSFTFMVNGLRVKQN